MKFFTRQQQKIQKRGELFLNRTVCFLALFVSLFFCSMQASAQIVLANTTPVTQNFDAMAATTTLPSNWRMAAQTTNPTYSGASTSVTQQASSGSPATGGTYNFGSSTSERAVGAMTSGSFDSPNSLIGFYRNTNANNLIQLTVSYEAERYRINTSAASVQFFYSLNGSTWVSVPAGDIATSSFPTGSSAYNFTSGTVINKTGIVISGLSVAQNSDIYLRWNLNTTGSSSQGIAIDDISVTAAYPVAPTVITTTTATSITSTGASSGGNVSADGGATVTARGVAYGTSANPTVAGTKTTNGTGTGTFTSAISGLLPNTQYFYRAYATNSVNTAYGPELNFTTSQLSAPVASAATTVTSGSFFANWAAVTGATSYRLDVSTSNAFGSFVPGFQNLTVNGLTQQVTGLASGTTYFYRVRAFATSSTSTNSNIISQATCAVITASAGANGSISPLGTTSVCAGGNQSYTITPAACYGIADVLVDGVSVGAVGTYTFTGVTADHTISATFALNTYTVAVTSGANGSITPGTGSVNCSDNATYTITPDACYAIADVVVDGSSVGAVGTYTFTNVTANHTISATFVLNTYTVTATAGANGSITPGTGSVNCSDNATYTITADPGFTISDVIADGVSQGAVGTYTFTNVTANHTISASFAAIGGTFTITSSAGANGTISPLGATVINTGDNQTYTITADACYSIADVVVDGSSVGAVGTYTFTNVTANHTISATFSLNTYTVTVTSGANGSITPGTGSVNCGDNATYTITPDACYAIADVVVDGSSVGAVGTYTFTNVTGNHTISATFALTNYTITVTSGANGSITPGTGSVNCGDNATYTITADACYSIADVVVDGSSVGAVGTYTFTNVTANHTISATFSLNTYTVTVTSGANGSITPGTGSVNCGDNATYTITPDACYAIADVVVDGSSVGAVGTYTFTNVTGNHTISATFVLTNYTITVTSGANGSITPGTGSVNCGANATYTITADACYSIADVVVDGSSVGAVGTYTFTNVTANHTISATFSLNTYTVTVTPGANGSITPGTGSVNCGANATYTITADACYSIADVVVDGSSVGAVGTYTFTNVTANHTISATFVLNTYTITVTAGANGSITPGTGSVNCGANATYTITANAGYAISDVVVDGSSVGAVGTYTFTNVTANHTISATFVANAGFTITATAGANGTIAPAGVTSVNAGANQSYTITPAACYHVNDVLVDGVSVGAVTSYTFTNVQANHTISASFAINVALAAPVVTGIVNVCPYIGTTTPITYTFNSAGATGYSYILPTNVTLISSTTNSVTVHFQNFTIAQPNKQLKVTALSPCGNSPQTIYYLQAQTPVTPSPITASSTDICPIIGTAGTITYTIAPVLGATSYQWAAQQPGNTTILHPNGPGINDTLITVSFAAGFTTSNITVASANTCGTNGNTRSITVVRANPSVPGLISGPTNACPNIAPAGTPATYSVAAVAGATTYTWTVPAGAIGLTGQGTSSISFTYPNGFTSGTVSVTATNGCGTSAARSLSINKLLPAAPSQIDVINTVPCPNRQYTYTIAATPANATSITWTVPAGALSFTGQNTTSITVVYPATAVTGTVTVQSFNNCGSSTIRSVAVKLPACPPDEPRMFSKGTTAPKATVVAETMQVSVYPNPTVSDFKLQVMTAAKELIKVRILDAQGRTYKQLTLQPGQVINIGSDLKAGAYMLETRQGNEVKITKLLKF